MPTYAYTCTSCGRGIEVFQRISDEPLTRCEACGGALRKVFYPAGILFKGSGFYATDNRPKPKESGESKPKESRSSEKKDSETKAPGSGDGGSDRSGSGSGSGSGSDEPGAKGAEQASA